MSLEIHIFGDLIWKNERGQWHRVEGPAFICAGGGIRYVFNNNFHRLDGPAVIYGNGDKYYFIHGTQYTKKSYWVKIKKL